MPWTILSGNKKTPLRGQAQVKADSFEPWFSRVRILYTHKVIRQSMGFLGEFSVTEYACGGLASEMTEEKGDQQRIDDIDEKGAHQRHDDECQVRSTVALRDRRHVGHGGRR